MTKATAIRGRLLVDRVVRGSCVAAVIMAVIPLGLVLWYVAAQGIRGIDLDFFTALPKPVGEKGGGMANAIVGTAQLVGLAALIGIPPGILAGVYLSEYGERTFGRVVRFAADVMSGIPSITIGLFVYALIVVRTKHFSGWAGAIALAILMLPTITRTTEELLKLVPQALREAALGLGVSKYKATLSIVLRTAMPGIATGVMLAIARVAGETAPLLFTAFGNRFWARSPNEPTASLPAQIYTYAVSPYAEWHRQAWAAALVLVTMVLLLNLSARIIVRHRVRSP
ncbi:MAG TPA: phosphate ABC transporter permease PstA [Polyangiaceae bacterium]